MINPTMRIEGLSNMYARLNKLAEGVQLHIMSIVLLELADDVAVTARSLVPVDTGALRDSIDSWLVQEGSLTEAFAGTTSQSLRAATHSNNSQKDSLFRGNQFYGGFWEFGHYVGKRGAGKRRGTKYVIDPRSEKRTNYRRKQFLAPAFDRHLEPWLQRLPSRLEEEMRPYMESA